MLEVRKKNDVQICEYFLFIVYLDCAEEQCQQNHGKYNKQIYLDIYMVSFQDKMQSKKQKNKTS